MSFFYGFRTVSIQGPCHHFCSPSYRRVETELYDLPLELVLPVRVLLVKVVLLVVLFGVLALELISSVLLGVTASELNGVYPAIELQMDLESLDLDTSE